MALSPTRSGHLGRLNTNLIEAALLERLRLARTIPFIYSNGFPVEFTDRQLADLQKTATIQYKIPPRDVVLPSYSWLYTRNTFQETVFAIEAVRQLAKPNERSLLVIADSLHMRRVLGAFKKQRWEERIDLYWISVEQFESYGPGYVQKRFRHPLFFFVYEILALAYSRFKGWA